MLLDSHGIYLAWERGPLLAGMPYPRSNEVWSALNGFGFRSVVCLATDKPNYDPSPLKLIHAAAMEDLFGGSYPQSSDLQQLLVRECTEMICLEIAAARSVVVHCDGGTGRTGTVISCVMRELGTSLLSVIETMKHINSVN